jgi:hypothetical protein
MKVDAGEVLGTGVLSVGVQEVGNDKVKKREGYLGKTVQQSVVGWWDVSGGAPSKSEEEPKEAFERVREAAGESPEGVKGE